jgi:uncharacterized protein (DUF1015 family)
MTEKGKNNLVKAFKALRPIPEKVLEVIAPPYDVISSDEARMLAENKPLSFLHISRPEIDLPAGTSYDNPEVYQQGLKNFINLIDEEILIEEDVDSIYVYEISLDTHKQTGIGCIASLDAYEHNLIKKHEHTTPKKEKDRFNNIATLNAQTGPVLLAHKKNDDLKDMVSKITILTLPLYDVGANDGSRHKIWRLPDGDTLKSILVLLNDMGALFIADGHHRSAAAAKVRKDKKAANKNHNGTENYNYVLVVAFPEDEMNILDYNRVVKGTNGHSKKSLLQATNQFFDIETMVSVLKPTQPNQFGMYFQGAWYKLELKQTYRKEIDPVKSLDVSLLHDYLLEPILGIQDERIDQRIDFVGGIRGMQALQERVDSEKMAIGFSLYPTPMNALISVAETNQIMPPKSTWFEPKLLDGLLTHLID